MLPYTTGTVAARESGGVLGKGKKPTTPDPVHGSVIVVGIVITTP